MKIPSTVTAPRHYAGNFARAGWERRSLIWPKEILEWSERGSGAPRLFDRTRYFNRRKVLENLCRFLMEESTLPRGSREVVTLL